MLEQNVLIDKITREVIDILNKNGLTDNKYNVPVGVSVRHLHITHKALEKLYGPGHKLTVKKDLTQPGEFAAEEVVTLVGKNVRSIENVRILGPVRDKIQVEIALTDAFKLGINPPVRKSGDLAGSASVTLVGPEGSLTLEEGVIRANRHIHMGPEHAEEFGVCDDETVMVEAPGEKGLVFHNVQVRVHEGWKLEMHLDTDDANAAGISSGSKVRILKG